MTDIELIEKFFGAAFERGADEDAHPDVAHFRERSHFDGFVYWNLLLDDKKQWMWISGNDAPFPAGFHIMELYVS